MIVLVQSTITSSPVESVIIIVVYTSSRMKRQCEYTVQLEIASLTIWIFQISLPVNIIHVKRIDGTLSV